MHPNLNLCKTSSDKGIESCQILWCWERSAHAKRFDMLFMQVSSIVVSNLLACLVNFIHECSFIHATHFTTFVSTLWSLWMSSHFTLMANGSLFVINFNPWMKNVSSNWSIEQTWRPWQADGVWEQGWMKKWNLTAYHESSCQLSFMWPWNALLGWRCLRYLDETKRTSCKCALTDFTPLGKVLGFGAVPQNRVLCKPLSVCVGGRPEPHRPAGSQSAKYSSGEEKSQIAVSLLLRVSCCCVAVLIFSVFGVVAFVFFFSRSAILFYLRCLLWGFLACCAEWRNARRMNGAYVPPVYVPDLHSDEKDDDLPPLSPSQTQHLLDHGGSMSSAAAVQQHPPQQQQQAAFHWTSGICACFDNMPVCMSLLFCYCCFHTYTFFTCAHVMIRFQFLLACITWE